MKKARIYDDGPPGIQHLGHLALPEQELLRACLQETLLKLPEEWEASRAKREVFWVNLWQRSGDGKRMEIARIDELDRLARAMATTYYEGEDVVLDGYQIINNPVQSKSQQWHMDYTLDYSNLFVPLSPLTPHNALQYLILPPSLPEEVYRRATTNLDHIDFDDLVNNAEYVSVRQLLAKPFSVIKLDFRTIHRGIGNTGDFDRIMFCVSVKKRGALLPPEPLFEAER
jgi:hypothetical protein